MKTCETCGGFPCQDISLAGNGAGLAGERSGLWFEYARLVGELRPAYVIVENVAALLGRGLDVVLGTLASLGYDAEWHCIPASSVGAPHRRDRLWIVAYPEGEQNWRLRKHGIFSDARTGSHETMADATSERCRKARGLRRNQSTERLPRRRQASVFAHIGKAGAERFIQEKVSGISAFSWCQDVRRAEDLRDRSDIPPPLFRGSRDGIPDWVDRVGACGNAVVPQIPELIGNAILESMAA